MKRISFAPLLFCAFALAASDQTNLTFTNLQGKVYDNVILVAQDPVSISVVRHAGYQPLRIDFTNLPQSVRDQFHYDPSQEAEFRARERMDTLILKQFKAEQALIKSQKHEVLAEFVRVVQGGILVNLIDGASPEDVARAMSGRKLVEGLRSVSRTKAVIYKYPGEDLVTGQFLHLDTYPFGNYLMAPVNGNSDQILRITADPHDLLAKAFYDRHPNWPQPDGGSEEMRVEQLEARLRDIDPQISAAEAGGILAGRHVPAAGTRTYFPAGRDAVSVPTKDGIPADVYDVIADHAAKNFPRSYDMQADYIANEVKTYKQSHP